MSPRTDEGSRTKRDERDGTLIIRASSVGDVVLTEPVVAAVRRAWPSSRIGFVVKDRYRDLVRGNLDIDTVHALADSSSAELARISAEIRGAGYARVVDLHANARSRFLAARSGARARTTYRKRDALDWVRVRVLHGTYRARRRIVERYLDALAPLGVPNGYERPRFHLLPGSEETARRILADAGFGRAPIAAVVPGSLWETKRWPAERFGEVARRLVSELGMDVLVLGSEEERALCGRVSGGERAVNLAGKVGLGDMAGLLNEANLFVGNDSGPTHVAMALDTPTVAIFGPTDPNQFDFRGHALVYAGLDCSACSFYGGRRCRRRGWDCMLRIGVEDVITAASELLERRRGA